MRSSWSYRAPDRPDDRDRQSESAGACQRKVLRVRPSPLIWAATPWADRLSLQLLLVRTRP
jgi:hypothetical protein